MFLTLELAAFFVEAPLRNPPRTDVKPHVITPVVLFDSLTVLRICLDVPSVVLVSLHLLDTGPFLSLNVPSHKAFERSIVLENLCRPCVIIRPDAKQLQNVRIRIL
jgi:hypothetical protein